MVGQRKFHLGNNLQNWDDGNWQVTTRLVWRKSNLPSGKLASLAGKWNLNEDVFPIENGDIPLLC